MQGRNEVISQLSGNPALTHFSMAVIEQSGSLELFFGMDEKPGLCSNAPRKAAFEALFMVEE